MTQTPPLPRPRFTGILVTGTMIAILFLIWRATTPAPPPSSPVPRHGGALTAAIHAEPLALTLFTATDQGSRTLAALTQGTLVRRNRLTHALEPWLAESWSSSPDGRTHTLSLRPSLLWSDGTPFTADDVVFTVEAVFDPTVFASTAASPLAARLTVARQPIRAEAIHAHAVRITFAGPSGQGLALLDALPIYPKHLLADARAAGTLASAWSLDTPPSSLAGTGPFIVSSVEPGVRLVLERNPHYWRMTADEERLPYLDRLTLEVVPDAEDALARVRSGDLDLLEGAIRMEDIAGARRAAEEGRLRLAEIGVSTDPEALWFCLKPETRRRDPRFAFVTRPEFRQAIAHAVDREAFATEVLLGDGVPVWGPVTTGHREWFSARVPRYPADVDRARALLTAIGLEDRTGSGVASDAKGTEARFTVLTPGGAGRNTRAIEFVQDAVAAAGIALDVSVVDENEIAARIAACDYDAIFAAVPMPEPDPAANLDFWLSSGARHVWNPRQAGASTPWESRIDALVIEQAAVTDPDLRYEMFGHVQRILGEALPLISFAAPRLHTVHTTRVAGVQPVTERPHVLWRADELGLAR